jgi:hypothetical protein
MEGQLQQLNLYYLSRDTLLHVICFLEVIDIARLDSVREVKVPLAIHHR